MKNNYIENFENREVGDILKDEPMKNWTTFNVGGPCDVMIFPKNESHLAEALNICKFNDIPWMILGNGSNLLVKDGGIRGAVIALRDNWSAIEIEDNILKAQSGALLKHIAEAAMEEGLSGLEFAHGIPGSVGGAITMNAGAYTGETKDVAASVRAVDKNGNIVDYNNEEMNFRYRHSRVQDEGLVVLSASYKLTPSSKEEVSFLMGELMGRRTSKQPLDMASAGSTFKRPEGYFAGQLIDTAGLRGLTHNGAQVSQKHCGFVVNKGGAKAKDVLELIEIVQKTVLDIHGVVLEREVKVIGED